VDQGFRLRAAGSASLGVPPDLAGSGKMSLDHINAVKARSMTALVLADFYGSVNKLRG
jgi:hypothetical protein